MMTVLMMAVALYEVIKGVTWRIGLPAASQGLNGNTEAGNVRVT